MVVVPIVRELASATWKRDTKMDSTKAWIIVAAVSGLLALAISTALLVRSFVRRRNVRKQLEEARQRDPCLGQKEFSRRRRMTVDDLLHEAEEQRETMINKSLASRSIRSGSMSSRWTFDNNTSAELETMPCSSLAKEKELESGLGVPRLKHQQRPALSFDEQVSRPNSAASNRSGRSSLRHHVLQQRQRELSTGWPLPAMPAPTLGNGSESRLQREPSLEQHPLFHKTS